MSAAVAQEESILEQIERCKLQINQYEAEIRKYQEELEAANQELDKFSDERQKYEVLSNIGEQLEKLNELGGSELFWSGLASENEIEGHLRQLNEKNEFFQRRIKKFTDQRTPDKILSTRSNKLPKGCEVLEVGVGSKFEDIYKKKYGK